ncbi:MAG TPA: alanine racemase [Halanaerobiales bacterium]|nr:alanine racemase [Halanaerobiales bacterium]
MEGYRTWLEINKEAIYENVDKIKGDFLKDQYLMGVVKGNANGYGTVLYSQTLQKAGVDWLGLTNIKEALTILKEGIKLPILILCDIPYSYINIALKKQIRLTVYDKRTVKRIKNKAKNLNLSAKVHIKINTGLNRIGVSPDNFTKLAETIKNSPHMEIEGAFTQFSTTHHFKKEKTRKQLNLFLGLIEEAKNIGIDIPILHAASTPSTLKMPETHLDMVRVGIGLAGLYPSKEYRKIIDLKFPLAWKSKVCQVKLVKQGEYVGYDDGYRCQKKTLIATIPVGTADGLTIKLAGRGYILIDGQRYDIVAVSMNHIMVDLKEVDGKIKKGDEVVIIGKQKNSFIDPAHIAKKINLDMEEYLCHINPMLPRIYY